MRSLVYATVVAAMGDLLGDPPRVYARGALGVDRIPASPEKPFFIIGEGPTTAYQSVSQSSDAELIPYEVYAYGTEGAVVQITELLRRLEAPVKALPGQVSTTGARCLGATWGGISQDFSDPDHEASVRFASFVLTGSHHKEA